MMVNLIQFEKLDILHVHYAIPHATSAYLAKQILNKAASNIPVITTLHGTDITLIGSDPTYKKVVVFSINESDVVSAVSEYLNKMTIWIFVISKEYKVLTHYILLLYCNSSAIGHITCT